MATTVARLQAVLGANTREFDAAMDRSQSRMHKVGRAAGIAGLAIAGGLAIGLKKSVHEAMEAETVQKRLAQAFKTAGLNIKPYAKAIEKADVATRKMGFSDEDAKTALGSLIVATKSYKKSRIDLNVAMDIARFKNIDLLQATKMLTMAQAGSQRATKQLGLVVQASTKNADAAKIAYNKQKDALDAQTPSLSKLNTAQRAAYDAAKTNIDTQYKAAKATATITDKQVTAAKVIDLVKTKLGGQAKAYSETTAGAMARFQAQTQELEEQLGKALLPALTSVTVALAGAAEFMQEHMGVTRALVVALAALAAILLTVSVATKLVTAATKIWTATTKIAAAAQWALNVAVSANPYVAAAVAIAALTTALVVLQVKYHAVTEAVQFLYKHEYILMAVPIIGWGLALGVALFKVRGAFISVGEAISNSVLVAVRALKGALDSVINAFKWLIDHAKSIGGIFGKIGGAIGGAIPGVGDVASGANAAIAAAKRPGYAVAGLQPETQSFLSLINRLYDDFIVTSGRRSPGENRRVGGAPMSDHLTGRAFDLVPKDGWNDHSIALFDKIAAYAAISPIVRWIGWRGVPGHGPGNHLHISTFDQGGWLKPGLTLAQNNTGRPEMVGGGNITIPVSIGGEHVATVVFDMLRRRAKVFEGRNGRAAFG